MTGDSLTAEPPPSGPLYARESDEPPSVGASRRPGGGSGPQTGAQGFEGLRAVRDRIARQHATARRAAAADHTTPAAGHVHDGMAAGLDIALRIIDHALTTAGPDAADPRDRLAADVECAIGLNVGNGGTEGVHAARDAVLAIPAIRHMQADLAALKTIARGYCPECGRGDCSPTTDQWLAERQRADRAVARVDRYQAVLLDCERRIVEADAALDRVRSLADEYPAGIDTALVHAALANEPHATA